ncbi:hypothetical protein [Winogradskyella rapida]|uniref:Outer membrane protein with beta-barrel domain n=1 Tax=Winogradskyella rapida TaxID=549701 RepID=A0ABW3KWR2_9FLAO
MNIITKVVAYVILITLFGKLQAQTTPLDSIGSAEVAVKIQHLKQQKSTIEEEEREILKGKIAKINKQLDLKEITAETAETLKKEAAKVAVLNIENRIDILDKRIALLERNGYGGERSVETIDEGYTLRIGGNEEISDSFIYLGKPSGDENRKYDKRTSTDIVFAFGFNNALIEGESLSDSPYKIGGSGFIELGYAWKTRIFENTNFWRLKYGFSFQWNKLNIKNNKYLVNMDGVIALQEYPTDVDKVKFRTTNLVFPMHLEFGPSTKIEKDNYFRYSTGEHLKIGLGGYAGVNLGNMQKVKYKDNGKREKDKQRNKFEVNEFVYGVSGYISLGGVALYAKYDLNPLFNNQAADQNNVSVGLRFDMD